MWIRSSDKKKVIFAEQLENWKLINAQKKYQRCFLMEKK